MKQPLRLALVLLVLTACVGCDQVTKEIARVHLGYGVTHSYVFDTLRLIHTENPGAFLNLGATLPAYIRDAVFVWVVGLFVAGLIGGAAFYRGLGQKQIVALALLAAGGLGNLIDRIMNDGRVTDFLSIGFGTLRTGIFNVADVAAMAGVALLFFSMSKGTTHTCLHP